VARILNEYYPHTNQPAKLANGTTATPNQTAAAVQAAIWFFSDRYVLNTSDALHDTVVAIVNRIRDGHARDLRRGAGATEPFRERAGRRAAAQARAGDVVPGRSRVL
jgi:TQXA domain-containing protein